MNGIFVIKVFRLFGDAFFRCSLICASVVVMSGCDNKNFDFYHYDHYAKKTKKEFEEILSPVPQARQVRQPEITRKTLPEFCSKKVSICISGKVPLSDVFLDIAKQADVSVAIDGLCKQSRQVFYRANCQSFIEVLDNICALSGLRYYFMNGTMHICEDLPYIKTHNIQFLLGLRKTQTQTSVKTDIFAEGARPKSGKSAADNGSNIVLNNQISSDFWQELEKALSLILTPPGGGSSNASYSLNKYSGVLSVRGTDRQQKMIESYIAQLQRLITTQILIEAKIIEITLSDEFKSGVNWNLFFDKKHKTNMKIPFGDYTLPMAVDPTQSVPKKDVFSFSIQSPNVSAIATFLEKFGAVRTIANPRLTVLNNQPAILKVARNEVFFELQVEDVLMPYPNPTIQKAESHIQTIPIGLVLLVQPSVNFSTGDVILYLHSTISRILCYKDDPAASVSSKGATKSSIPITQTREMDTVITGKHGETIITGGLMEETSANDSAGLPGMAGTPILGDIFGSRSKERQVTELVILLKLTILDSSAPIPVADDKIYRTFFQDPRPF
ncbi:pilus (MSHA type) biogenesis protein MshL [Candidatus Hydrogenosomobacter endosymbioticus]|nr:pilus (MSHA type) biogenesis protein MshL [Candidatus Hydrogenosomobacter endosymbioticus]